MRSNKEALAIAEKDQSLIKIQKQNFFTLIRDDPVSTDLWIDSPAYPRLSHI